MSQAQLFIPKSLVSLRAQADAASTPERASEPSSGADAGAPAEKTTTAFDVKAIQRKAFERGREVEAEQSTNVLRRAATTLQQEAEALRGARASDAAQVEEFCIQLAHVLAEHVVGRMVDLEQHDVRATARRILDDALPDLDAPEVTMFAHPNDLALLPDGFGAEGGGPAIRVAPDPRLARGSFRVQAQGAEYYSGISERLAEAKDRLLEEVQRADRP